MSDRIIQLNGRLGLNTPVSMAIKSLDIPRDCELTQSIVLPFIPPTLNEMLEAGKSKGKGGHFKLVRLKQEWTARVSGFVSMAGMQPYGKGDLVWAEFIWYVAFRRDFDNLHSSVKYLLDGLKDAGIVPNDNLVVFQSPVLHWHEKSDSKGDRVILTLSNTPRYVAQRMGTYSDSITDALDDWKG